MKSLKNTILISAIICLGFANFAFAAKQSKPNIIFILTDDQRYDEIAAVGNFPWLVTPNLDKLLKNGIHFKNAFVTTSLCGPSRASFLTGTYANRHGVVVVNETVDYDKKLPSFVPFCTMLVIKPYFGKWHQAMHNRPDQDLINGWCFGDKVNISMMLF